MAVAGVNAARRLQTVDLRHLYVHQDEVVRLRAHRLHRFDAAVERALRDWEQVEELGAR